MPVIYSNNASTTLSAGINNSTTTIGIASASGFPSIGSGEYYFATIANTNNTKIEVVKVTAGTTSLTVTRAQDGTTAQAFDSGDNFQLRVTAATLGAATKTDVNITGGAIAGAAISNDAIDSQHYADGSIDHAHLSNDCIDGDNIQDDAIDSEHYTDGSIDTAHIADDAVTAAKLANSINTDIATGVTANTTANAALPKAGGAMTGNVTHADNVRAQFGAGNDLEIYHDGTDSFIHDSGSGNLELRTNGVQIGIMAINGSEYMGKFVQGNQVELYHNNSKKIETTANGVTVTGNVYATGAFGKDDTDKIQFSDNTNINFVVNGNDEMRLEADGDLHVDGDVIAYSTTISDAALKYDINPVEFALDKINQLKGVSYKYKHNDRESAGLLAQDVEKVMPSAVSTKKLPLATGTDKEYKTLHYDSMTAILVEAIKELTAKVKKLENK